MKTIVRHLGVLAVVLAAMTANAQNPTRARVTVPFAFSAAGTTLPAGEYRISFDETDRVVTLSGEGTNAIVLLSTSADELKDPRTFLRFEHVGSQFFLQQVAISGIAQQISERAEKKLVAQKDAVENSTGGHESSGGQN